MWFTETGGNKIGAITTAGAITEYTLPTANAQPQYIARGTDGNLWFAEAAGNKIGRITTSGVITEFPVPTTNAMPHGIAAGADGNLWFTEPMAGKVASITTAGAITEYSAGISPNSYPSIITAGPGGLMWFSNENSASVGSITTGNAAPTPAPPPTPSGPTNVVTPVTKNLRATTKDGRTTITFTLRYAASGNYSFRLETKAGKVLPMLAGSDVAGVTVKKTTTKAVAVKNAKAGKVVKVKVIMKGKPTKGTALRAIIAGTKGSRTTETIPV
jgi:streptogramin lyase